MARLSYQYRYTYLTNEGFAAMSLSDAIATTTFPVWVETLETPAPQSSDLLLVAITREDHDLANVDWKFF